MSHGPTETDASGDAGPGDTQAACSCELLNENMVNLLPRCNPGSAPCLFSQLCTADDKTRVILARAAHALLYDDGSRRPFTHLSLRLLDEALATGHPDALILKGVAMELLEKDPIKPFQEAERQGSNHPFLFQRLGEYYYKKKDFNIVFQYMDKALKCMYLPTFTYPS